MEYLGTCCPFCLQGISEFSQPVVYTAACAVYLSVTWLVWFHQTDGIYLRLENGKCQTGFQWTPVSWYLKSSEGDLCANSSCCLSLASSCLLSAYLNLPIQVTSTVAKCSISWPSPYSQIGRWQCYQRGAGEATGALRNMGAPLLYFLTFLGSQA